MVLKHKRIDEEETEDEEYRNKDVKVSEFFQVQGQHLDGKRKSSRIQQPTAQSEELPKIAEEDIDVIGVFFSMDNDVSRKMRKGSQSESEDYYSRFCGADRPLLVVDTGCPHDELTAYFQGKKFFKFSKIPSLLRSIKYLESFFHFQYFLIVPFLLSNVLRHLFV
jgi:hypothetical protein